MFQDLFDEIQFAFQNNPTLVIGVVVALLVTVPSAFYFKDEVWEVKNKIVTHLSQEVENESSDEVAQVTNDDEQWWDETTQAIQQNQEKTSPISTSTNNTSSSDVTSTKQKSSEKKGIISRIVSIFTGDNTPEESQNNDKTKDKQTDNSIQDNIGTEKNTDVQNPQNTPDQNVQQPEPNKEQNTQWNQNDNNSNIEENITQNWNWDNWSWYWGITWWDTSGWWNTWDTSWWDSWWNTSDGWSTGWDWGNTWWGWDSWWWDSWNWDSGWWEEQPSSETAVVDAYFDNYAEIIMSDWSRKSLKVVVSSARAPIPPTIKDCPVWYYSLGVNSNVFDLTTFALPYTNYGNNIRLTNESLDGTKIQQYLFKIMNVGNVKIGWVVYKTIGPDFDYFWAFNMCAEN